MGDEGIVGGFQLRFERVCEGNSYCLGGGEPRITNLVWSIIMPRGSLPQDKDSTQSYVEIVLMYIVRISLDTVSNRPGWWCRRSGLLRQSDRDAVPRVDAIVPFGGPSNRQYGWGTMGGDRSRILLPSRPVDRLLF